MRWSAFQSLPRRSIRVGSHRLSAVDVGDGPPLVLLHGNPTWSYQWRDFLGPLSQRFRCLAPDLLGFGRSDRIGTYDWDTHYEAIDGLFQTLPPALIIAHDWGGALAALLAVERPERVTGLVLIEPQLLTETWDDYRGARRARFEALRDPARNVALLEEQNVMVEQIPDGVLRTLSAEEMNGYRDPFPTPADRVPIRRFVEMKPIGPDSETYAVFQHIEQGLQRLAAPVLLLTVEPGALMPPAKAARVQQMVPALELRHLGPGHHHCHEDYPLQICDAVLDWAATLPVTRD